MVCMYHKTSHQRHLCQHNCPMRGIFTSKELFQQLYSKLGGHGVFRNFFKGRTTVECKHIAKALQWVTDEWAKRHGGPILAIEEIEAEIIKMKRKGFVVDRNFKYDPLVDVSLGPDEHDGTFKCRYHQRVKTKCEGCMFEHVFPCYSNKATFKRIYDKFGNKEVIPGFFNGNLDVPTRQLIARSLTREAQMWIADPIDGPRGVFVRLDCIFQSLYVPSLAHLAGGDEERNWLCLGTVGLQEDLEIESVDQELDAVDQELDAVDQELEAELEAVFQELEAVDQEPELVAVSLAHLVGIDAKERNWLCLGTVGLQEGLEYVAVDQEPELVAVSLAHLVGVDVKEGNWLRLGTVGLQEEQEVEAVDQDEQVDAVFLEPQLVSLSHLVAVDVEDGISLELSIGRNK